MTLLKSTCDSEPTSSKTEMKVETRRSWCRWTFKASPVAQVALKNVGVANGGTSEMDMKKRKQRTSGSLTKLMLSSNVRSSKGDPIAASMTKLNVSKMNVAQESLVETTDSASSPPDALFSPKLPQENSKFSNDAIPITTDKQDAGTSTSSHSGWWGLWSGPIDKEVSGVDKKDPLVSETSTINSSKLSLGNHSSTEGITDDQNCVKRQDAARVFSGEVVRPAGAENATTTETLITQNDTERSSWFWSWFVTENSEEKNPAKDTTLLTEYTEQSSSPSNEIPKLPNSIEVLLPLPGEAKQSKSFRWSYWFQQKPCAEQRDKETSEVDGAVGIANTPSQSTPKATQFDEQENQPTNPVTENSRPTHLRGKDVAAATTSNSKLQLPPSQTLALPSSRPSKSSKTSKPKTICEESQKTPSNLLLPDFHDTYRQLPSPTYLQRFFHSFLGSTESERSQLRLSTHVPHIKSAIAIGVHGYFPAPLIQRVIGQPTGTSVRFANAAAEAIANWTMARGCAAEIEKIALDGEGQIQERVRTLWELLSNWIERIKAADFILVACHSQGVPVAIMLVSKLIRLGHVDRARISVCAMAGVNLGPFVDYRSWVMQGGSAGELFEFSRKDSDVSKAYREALEESCQAGARILYAGSIDDQLVSLESSTFSTIDHPHIYRAAFVNGRVHRPDFMTHLIGFVLKLRNLGISDHGLIRELSPAIAGRLYSGEGHSRIYDDPSVYTLAVELGLETIHEKEVKGLWGETSVKLTEEECISGMNSFFLPWAMRGVLEEELVKKTMQEEVRLLLKEFETWKPQGKALKDVKMRLEAVRTKLYQ